MYVFRYRVVKSPTMTYHWWVMLLDFRSLSFTTGQLSGETQNIRLHTIYGLFLTQNSFFENEFNSNETVYGWSLEVSMWFCEIQRYFSFPRLCCIFIIVYLITWWLFSIKMLEMQAKSLLLTLSNPIMTLSKRDYTYYEERHNFKGLRKIELTFI